MTIENNSGITPVGVSILVLPDQVSETTASGIVVATNEQLDREQMKQTDGVVIAIAPNAFYDEKDASGKVRSRCKVGDRIIMTAFAGMVRKGEDNLSYRLIRDNDVIGILKRKENE